MNSLGLVPVPGPSVWVCHPPLCPLSYGTLLCDDHLIPTVSGTSSVKSFIYLLLKTAYR